MNMNKSTYMHACLMQNTLKKKSVVEYIVIETLHKSKKKQLHKNKNITNFFYKK